MTAADEIYDAIRSLDTHLVQFAYLAPEQVPQGIQKQIAVSEAQLAILNSAHDDASGSHDEPNAFALALDLARAINGLTS